MEDSVGVLVTARVLATHGCLSADDLAQVVGPSAAAVPSAARAVEPAGERAVDAWERKLRRLFSELVAMEQLLLALASAVAAGRLPGSGGSTRTGGSGSCTDALLPQPSSGQQCSMPVFVPTHRRSAPSREPGWWPIGWVSWCQ